MPETSKEREEFELAIRALHAELASASAHMIVDSRARELYAVKLGASRASFEVRPRLGVSVGSRRLPRPPRYGISSCARFAHARRPSGGQSHRS